MITPSQVANATRGQLLKITYDLLLGSLDKVKKYGQEKAEKESGVEIGRSRQIIQELIDTLDFKQEISQDLLRIYVYINGLLIKSLMVYDRALIDEAKGLINQLLEGWNGAIANDSKFLINVSFSNINTLLLSSSSDIPIPSNEVLILSSSLIFLSSSSISNLILFIFSSLEAN